VSYPAINRGASCFIGKWLMWIIRPRQSYLHRHRIGLLQPYSFYKLNLVIVIFNFNKLFLSAFVLTGLRGLLTIIAINGYGFGGIC
jgi:hypothetical protein